MKILEFDNKYRKQTIDLLIDIAVDEHNFPEWKDELLQFKNEFFKYDGGNCWIALEGDKVVGTISLRKIDNDCAEVKNLYILKEKRGASSVGKDLFNTLVDFAKQVGYTKLRLDTYKHFDRAIKFYEKNGFYIIDDTQEHTVFEKNLK